MHIGNEGVPVIGADFLFVWQVLFLSMAPAEAKVEVMRAVSLWLKDKKKGKKITVQEKLSRQMITPFF